MNEFKHPAGSRVPATSTPMLQILALHTHTRIALAPITPFHVLSPSLRTDQQLSSLCTDQQLSRQNLTPFAPARCRRLLARQAVRRPFSPPCSVPGAVHQARMQGIAILLMPSYDALLSSPRMCSMGGPPAALRRRCTRPCALYNAPSLLVPAVSTAPPIPCTAPVCEPAIQ